MNSSLKKILSYRRPWIWIAASVVIAGLAAGAAALFRKEKRDAERPVVEVQRVFPADVSVYGEYVGRIRAKQYVEVRARVEGYLESMLFAEGTFIKKGQTLFVIDPTV